MIPALAFLKGVPRWAWSLLAVVALCAGLWLHGRSSGKQACLASQAAAEARADVNAAKVAGRAVEKAESQRADTRKATKGAANEVRIIYRDRDCALPMPDRVRVLGQDAVERARGALPAGTDG